MLPGIYFNPYTALYFTLSLVGIYGTYLFIVRVVRKVTYPWTGWKYHSVAVQVVALLVMGILLISPDPIIGGVYFALLTPLGLFTVLYLIIKRLKR
jgi:hypothetical protein